nr:reverse transcriptase domain-containing protein [Tanacetum cinerariifolium]
MAETIEQYTSKTRADHGSGVARPKIENKDNFEPKGQFLKELRTNTFSGSNHEDANEHIEKVLEIIDLFHIPNITIDRVMLRAFPMSLTKAASRWLRNEPTSSITTWNGWGYKAAAQGFYQRNNANPSYQERRQSMQDTLSKCMSESTQRHEENSNLIKEIQASTDATIRNQGASIKTLENPNWTSEQADSYMIRRIGSAQYAVSTGQNHTLISLDPFFKDYNELNDLNEPIELRRNQGDNLMPTVDQGEVTEEFRTRNDDVDIGIDDYPSYCDYDKKVNLDNSTSNVLILLDSWTSGLLVYKEPLSSKWEEVPPKSKNDMPLQDKEYERRHRSRRFRSPRPIVFLRIKRDRSRSPRQNSREKEGGVFKRLENRGNSMSARSDRHNWHSYSRYMKALSESEDNRDGHWKSRSKKKKLSREEDNLSQPWVCEVIDPFTPRICYFDFLKTRMPSHIKTYDEIEDPKDHTKIFQAAAKTERWAMPTWCHMFNSTLMGNARVCFNDLPTESIDGYNDLKKAFLENYLQQKKCIKDPIEHHNIKQRDGESTEDFVRMYKLEAGMSKEHHSACGSSDSQKITQSFSPNPEILFPPLWEDKGIKGPMVIEAEIGGHCIHHMYVDGGSASEILYEHCFNQICSKIKNQLMPSTTPLIGFDGEIIWPTGQIQLLVKIKDGEHSTAAWMNFVAVRSPSLYNGILGRSGVKKLQAVPSTAHGMLKLPMKGGAITLKTSRLVPLEGTMVSGPERNLSDAKQIVEERVKVAINPEYPKQTVMIDSTLSEEGRNKLCDMLQHNLEIFSRKHADMTDVPRHIAQHHLNIREGCPQVRQKKRGQAADRNKAIQEEVKKLEEAGIMKEVHYHVWLSNLVMVKRHEGSWWMCVDFKDLNRACLKDGYSLPEIDSKEGMFLGYTIKTKGLKVCPDKVDVVLSLPSLKCLKDVQNLNGKLTSLNRFLAKSAEKSLPFFKTLKKYTKKSDLHWTAEAEEAFKQMKQLTTELSMLTVPVKRDELIGIKRSGDKLYISGEISDGLGRLQKWSIELGEYEIHYRPRVSVKGKILADIIVEQPEEDSLDTVMETKEELLEPWILFIDESSCTDGSGGGLILTNPKGMEFTYALTFSFKAFSIRKVPRSENKKANALSRIASTSFVHLSTRSVVAKALRIGYYWPTMHKDARTRIKACQDCQVHKPVPRNPQQLLTPSMSLWSFYKWGINIARPFLERPGKVKFLIVAMDYFTKWIEAKPVATITGNQNRSGHPNRNQHAHTKDAKVDLIQNNEALEINLDLLEERREQEAIHEAKSKAKLERYYNSKVQNTSFKAGDLVYCNNDASRAEDTEKLGPK